MNHKESTRARRHLRIRAKIAGTNQTPRLVVFRSNLHTYAQMINDEDGKVLFASSDATTKGTPGGASLGGKLKVTKMESAKKIGVEVAKLAKEKGITKCVFDRNGYKYHGRVKAVAQGAREGGLQF